MTDTLIQRHPIKQHARALRSSSGFTMVEILMVLAIMSIAFGTIYKSFEHLNRSSTTENVKAGVQQSVRIAVDFMVQDIRLAGLNPLGTPNIGIQAIVGPPDSSIRFTMDANFDGDDDDTFEDMITIRISKHQPLRIRSDALFLQSTLPLNSQTQICYWLLVWGYPELEKKSARSLLGLALFSIDRISPA